jgi:hypothetical protein
MTAFSKTPASEPPQSTSPDPLSMRWAMILQIAAVAGSLVGALTFAQTRSWPAALLAGLGAAGVSLPVSHQILGR